MQTSSASNIIKRRSRSRSSFMQTVKPQAKCLRGKLRFKAFVRRLIWSIPWYKETDEEAEGQIMQIATRTRSKRGIRKEAKRILIKPDSSRTVIENGQLIGFLGGLYFYNRYPKQEHEQLIMKTNFVSYGAGRVILKQDHMVNSNSCLYYIVNGHLSVELATTHPITLAVTVDILKKLGPGDFFGEVAILFNDVRESSITTLTTVNLLYITKEDFDAILKESLEKEWSRSRDAMTDLPYFFKDWTEVELRKCSIISQLTSYNQGDLVLGEKYGKEKKAHFVVNGSCIVIQNIKVKFRNSKPFLISSLKNIKPASLNIGEEASVFALKPDEVVEDIYLQTNIFTKGACFGVGEKRKNRRYVAGNGLTCLLVPQYLLLAHKRFDSYRQFLESRLFSESNLFDAFVYLRNRQEFRHKVVTRSSGRASKINNTTIWDVPHYYRVLAPQVGGCKVPDHIVDNSPHTRRLLGLKSMSDENMSTV